MAHTHRYYHHPWNSAAYSGVYNSLPQYMLGDAVLVAPPYTQLSNAAQPATSPAKPYPVWLPTEFEWHPMFNNSGEMRALF